MTALQRLAREVLASHSALIEVRRSEPPCDPDSGLPVNPYAWSLWYDKESTPAYLRWSQAIDALAEAVDDPGFSRHPINFRPRCEAILAEASC